jgi:hypothetical protein
MEYIVYLTVYEAFAPEGAVYVKVTGFGAVPDMVKTVVPNVSVKTPLLFTLIWFPFLSVTNTEAPGFKFVPELDTTYPEFPVAKSVYPEPS